MKKTIFIAVIATAVCAISTPLLADNTGKTYAGMQYAIGSYNEDGFKEVNPTALVGRFGKYFNNNFALEARLGSSLKDDNSNTRHGVDVALEMGVYGVGHINLNEKSSIYGLIGYSRVNAKVLGPSVVAGNESGISFGVGVDVGITDNTILGIEYAQYLSKSNFDFSAIGLGVIFSF